jgi:hypothetical protein
MDSRAWSRNCDENIVVVLHILFQSVQEIVTEEVARVRPKTLVAVHKDNRVVVSPLLFRSMPVLAVHHMQQLLFVDLHYHLVDEVSHQD